MSPTVIVVTTTLQSITTPTISLLSDEVRKANKTVEVIDWLCESTWAEFEAGDQQGYLEEVAASSPTTASRGDIIVLAQASMAGADALCPDLFVPV